MLRLHKAPRYLSDGVFWVILDLFGIMAQGQRQNHFSTFLHSGFIHYFLKKEKKEGEKDSAFCHLGANLNRYKFQAHNYAFLLSAFHSVSSKVGYRKYTFVLLHAAG